GGEDPLGGARGRAGASLIAAPLRMVVGMTRQSSAPPPMLKTTIALGVLLLIVAGGRHLWARGSARVPLHVPTSGGLLILRPPRLQGILLGFGALLPGLVFGAFAVRAWGSGGTGMGGRIAVVVPTALTLGLSVHQFLSAFRQRIVVHLAGFQRFGVASRREMRWDDVVSVAYNPMNRWF